jgi:2-polyprenyl-6-methoxyphenol hydroxylase-like FAD-dependent oxidoreductase
VHRGVIFVVALASKSKRIGRRAREVQKVRKRRAIIIGGSLGGLLVAHQLRSIGWDIDVFERTGDDLADRGAGIGTHPDLFEAMQRVGLTLDTSDCTQPQRYVCLDQGQPAGPRSRCAAHHDGLVPALSPSQG